MELPESCTRLTTHQSNFPAKHLLCGGRIFSSLFTLTASPSGCSEPLSVMTMTLELLHVGSRAPGATATSGAMSFSERKEMSVLLLERTAMLELLLFERRATPLLFGGPMMSTSGWRVNVGRAVRAVTSWMMGLSGVREPLPLIGVWPSTGLSRGFRVTDPRSSTTRPVLASSWAGPLTAPNDGTYARERSDTKIGERSHIITVTSHNSVMSLQITSNSTDYSTFLGLTTNHESSALLGPLCWESIGKWWFSFTKGQYIDGLVQERRSSIANTPESFLH